MRRTPLVNLALAYFVGCATLTLAACGEDEGIADVFYGETTLVVIVNPVVNDVTDRDVPAPGPTQRGIDVVASRGPAGTTDVWGVAVLAPLDAGDQAVGFRGEDVDGTVTIAMAAGELHEVAIAADGARVEVMADVRYAFGGTVIEVEPSTPLSDVNDALAISDSVVFFHHGVYAGDLVFSGSNVTLFGQGPVGGRVVLEGDVTVSGSGNRIRGALITGGLTVPGSDVGISFSVVEGPATVSGSDAVLLANVFCQGATVSGSGTVALGNAGLTPLAPSDACP